MSGTDQDVGEDFVSGEYIKSNVLEDREYQAILTDAAIDESTLIALPTGTGKTAVAARLISRRLELVSGKVVMLAPTQPLVNQHVEFFREVLSLPDHEVKSFTGDISPDDRVDVWNGSVSVIVATPEVIENDLIGNRYDMSNVVCMIFDECHRATGDYAYNYIGERYHGNSDNPLAIGLSASPGSSKDEILDVCSNIGLTNVEVLNENDDVLKDYLYETKKEYKWIDVPDKILEAKDLVQSLYKEKLVELKKIGVLNSAKKDLSVKQLIQANGKIQRLIDNEKSDGYRARSVHAEAMKLVHGWKTIETQSTEAAISYFEKIIDEAKSADGSKAAERIASNPKVKKSIRLLREYDDVHPKLSELRVQVGRTLIDGGKVLVFTESRDSASEIVDFLDDGNINPTRFVGQSNRKNDKGMTQTQQKQTLKEFSDGEYNVLVSTSVGEEGIDIPAVDLVLFYEPVPNAIRAVQRRGRTGRETEGKVVILIAKGTSDEQSYFISKQREDRMKEQLEKLKQMEDDLEKELTEQQSSLSEFGSRDVDGDEPVVYIDNRETKSEIGKLLDRMDGITLKLGRNKVGDYIVSDRMAIERKQTDDFINSLIAGERDLFDQVGELVENFSKPVVIVEGVNGVSDLYGKAQVSEEAVRSALHSLTVDFDVSLLVTRNEEETTKNIRSLARREQVDNDKKVSKHGTKSTSTLHETQEYVVSSIPTVGPVTAELLLEYFGTVKDVFNASAEELKEVEGVGEKTVEQIHDVMESEYKK